MNEGAEALRKLASEVSRSAAVLHAVGGQRRARWLADAFAQLSRADSELGREARTLLAQGSGLTEPMVEWALESALAPLTFEALSELERSPPPPHPGAVRVAPGQLCVVVLAGNVVTGAARAVGWPLLFGWPVLAKASSGDDTLARLLEAALAEGDPELASAYRTVTYPAGQDSLNHALFEQADAVSVYGSDATVNALRAELGATVSFMAHGNGLGVAFLGRAALATQEDAQLLARALALDVAAYDQRGCLSPHTAWVQHGGHVSPEQFAELVHGELALLGTTLPRGPLPRPHAAAQLSWRGVGSVRGSLFEGDGFAVSYEDDGPLRVSPGYRNLQVLGIDAPQALGPKLAPLGVHLKCLAYAGIPPSELLDVLPTRLAPRLCPLGHMQRPPVNALHDGLPAWEGLLRWADCPPQ
ncbi:MAG: Acyl-CoA reductase [Myxococcaceae bacterium]|nr:Acyl-CoA reductase [Myxococcaceae bacterium]